VAAGTLAVRLFESGQGETIVIEFPTGETGVVDAHPCHSGSRLPISDVLGDRRLAFVCLTHPHEDHALDLIHIIRGNPVEQFWHSLSSVNAFLQAVRSANDYLSPIREFAHEMAVQKAKFMTDLWNEIDAKNVTPRALNSSFREFMIGEVKICILGPTEGVILKEEKRLRDALRSTRKKAPDPNKFSLIIVLEYKNISIILAADALRHAWREAETVFRAADLPKASVIKVPHHGAKNAFYLDGPQRVNCWNLCAEQAMAVLFAGDVLHPDKNVYEALRKRFVVSSHFRIDPDRIHEDPLRLLELEWEHFPDERRNVEYGEFVVEVDFKGELTLKEIPPLCE
jgi:beta-lactamase superfamily II metal-dependent hydrolase